jgi:hypothetical protein
MSDQAKRDLRDATFAAETEIDALFAAFGRDLSASVRRHAEDGQVTPVTRHLVLSDLEPLLDRIYGVHQGQPSALGELIVRVAGELRATVVTRTIASIRRSLKHEPDLLRAMGDHEP